ncbi:AraC family transcriptional regulator InvF [Chromobacterium amazonense]|uniref:AraC family transcriptional regulator InvF n=1 Tax=Chromobacterium amazonense TaxID=1382803 RepID=UPI003F7A3A9C
MTDHEVLNLQEVLGVGAKHSVPTQEVWLLEGRAGQSASLELSWSDGRASWEVPDDWQGLLLLERVDVHVATGELRLRPLRLEVLSKLLAFIDEAQGTWEGSDESYPWASLPLDDSSIWQERKRYKYWFLQQLLRVSPAFIPLLALLRHSESYCLVRFLLAQSTCSNTLQDLGRRYGVSESHFRRLCRHALGGAAKAELRDWRMARSLLEVVEGKESLTQVALKHGYASSSHFSNEIRVLLGISPRGLSNIIQLATK